MNEVASMITTEKFCDMVELNVQTRSMSYIESVTHVCESLSIEPEDVSKLITPPIKKMIKTEAAGLNLLKRKGQRLPV